MKTAKLSIALTAIIMVMFTHQSSGQLVNFYSSPGYSNFISTMIDNSIWKSSMEKYTKEYKPGPGTTKPDTSRQSKPEVVPEYRRYPAVQFKSTGTRLTLQPYLDAVQITEKEKKEIKEVILKIYTDYEAAAALKGLPNDWALAYVSYVGINNHIYYGQKEKPIIPFEQNVGLRDVVAEQATSNELFKNVTDKEKQELYELMVMLSGLTYYFYEKALKENNAEEIKNCKLSAAQHLQIVGIKVQ
jgi:hypothetical protein